MDQLLFDSINYNEFNGIKYAIEHGANVHVRDDFAVRWSSKNGHLEVVRFLVEQGADIHARDDYAVCWAAENGHLEVVQFLVEHGADIHADDDYAVRWAAEKGHLDWAEELKAMALEAALAAVKRFQAWLGHSVAIKSSRVIRRQLSEQARRA